VHSKAFGHLPRLQWVNCLSQLHLSDVKRKRRVMLEAVATMQALYTTG
jgi:hypothetical protein